MLFNSIEFAIFLPIVFFIYWFILDNNLKLQNAFLLLASYLFYGWWDWRFLSLILFSTLIDYFIGIKISQTESESLRKRFLGLSIFLNLGFLGFFKYFNFFTESFANAFTLLGQEINPISLNIILPVGISFYTFQTLSYSVDVYKRKLSPTKDFIAFSAFVTFFPQLVAGPIERATNLLPQFYNKREFNYNKAVDGLQQILWGLFKKVVIADNCAVYASQVFNNYEVFSGSTLLVGAIYFAFQIYGDFSGYSDIAIGSSRLFGFDLMQNFNYPYFSRDIAEFWRRWHISLSTWFRDYVYIPLGGSKGSTFSKVKNTFIIFMVSGFWHGANWTFIAWGFINACYFLPILLLEKNRVNTDTVAQGRFLLSFREAFQVLSTFFLTVIAWVFFRSASITEAFGFLERMFSNSFFTKPKTFDETLPFLILFFLCIEYFQREKKFGLEFKDFSLPRPIKWGINYFIIWLLFWYGGSQQEFIYFQF